MTKIPLKLRLKKVRHRKIAQAQDLVVKELYNLFNNAVLHGGTAIWRCYQGNRFSEDIDVYLSKKKQKINQLFQNLEKKGFTIKKKKFTQSSLYSKLDFQRITVRLEALFKKVDGELMDYETAEGNLITIYTLLPETLLKEKINAYLKRKKIRDLYDIFFLLKKVEKKKVKQQLRKLINNFTKPEDEKDLKALIIEGLVPSSKKMVNFIKRYT